MSRQPSPTPNNHNIYHHQSSSREHHAHHGTSLTPSASASSALTKQRSLPKGYTPGITAGAEDSKYQTKYKELKKKVKEIELDNDKLYLKLLLAKKNIRRMNLERAILYERLAAVPPTPGRHPQDLPPESDPLFSQQPPAPQTDITRLEANEAAIAEYLRAHPNARVVQGHHGRPIAIEDLPTSDIRTGTSVPPPPPPGISIVHSFRHDSAPGLDPRYPPPVPPGIPAQSVISGLRDPYDEPPVSNTRSIPPPPPPPPQQGGFTERGSGGWASREYHHREHRSHSNASSGHHHRRHHSDLDSLQGEREHERTRDRDRDQHGSGRLEALRGSRRSSISGHNEIPPPPPDPRSTGGSGRRHDRHDFNDIGHPHDTRHPHQHIQISTSNLPPSPPSLHSPTNSRGSRMHGHQRIGPGAHIHRDSPRDPEYELELQRGRELERAREREREENMRYQMAMEEEEMRLWRQEHGLMGPGIPHGRSRSDTPNSGSGHENTSSRPPSGQSYERSDRESRGTARYGTAVHHSNILGLEPDYGDQIHSSRESHSRHIRHGSGHGYVEMTGGGGGSGSGSGSLRSPLESHHSSSVAAGLSDSMEHRAKRMRSPMLSRVRDDSMDEDD
ncbi:unnamed protein product [Somion occarium]|uniref:INO80 complex subunit F domain-containing protein n=1 Tax=Somion occarium TaxID=3059160 RepID=A0ABP1D2Q0_9APHY